ncbi:hypothetical protein [Rhizobium rhizogenes]|uniref:hypothetical protein n=1 Tax=Rhizobium rhizogenes TaxID=359 RepID=UPI001573ED04|nr:hypothetical protein [Rhizobium rhizogenes]NTI76603.1 hypothetical protein [Rhizobium rhizogenes]
MTARFVTDIPTIVATGFFALDVVVDCQQDIPAIAQAGGTCGNVLAIMAHLGWRASAVSRMSADRLSDCALGDLRRAGVNVDLASVLPSAPLTLIQQRNWTTAKGKASHRFFWSCPHCGKHSEPFRPLTLAGATSILDKLGTPDVFFLDRVSPASAFLAAEFSKRGTLVVFEPSGRLDARLLQQVLQCAAIVKYPPLYEKQMQLLMTNRRKSKCLEIRTQSEDGLYFRLMQGDFISDWRHIQAQTVDAFVDSSGAGDWCTAGIVAEVGRKGATGFDGMTDESIEAGIRAGSRLAAINCRYLGARGAMRREISTSILRDSNGGPAIETDLHAATAFLGCSQGCSPAVEKALPKIRHRGRSHIPELHRNIGSE